MKKNCIAVSLAAVLALGLSACGTGKPAPSTTNDPNTTTPVVETFAAEYEMKGTTSAGLPKNDTFIFEGTTTDGIITELNFDIIRNKGLEGEYSKKDIMGYMMNVSDATVEKDGDNFVLKTLTSNGYDTALKEGAQFMVTASAEKLTDETTFKDLTFVNLSKPTEPFAIENALICFQYVATEAGIEKLTADTPVKDILSKHGLYADGSFVEGTKRIAFTGFNGGRSYGEQMDAIVAYILENKMTLEDVYTMFQTVNQQTTPIEERDTISGATIAFVGDFQRMVYVAINGELFEGVVNHSEKEGNTVVEVVTQGYGGEIETNVTFDSEGKITAIAIRDAQETPDVGGKLTVADSEFIQAIIAGQDGLDKVEAVSGATVTSKSLIKAVQFAQEYYKGL